ncbi:hypothetical protein ACWIF8_23045 [Micromonospora chalcea]
MSASSAAAAAGLVAVLGVLLLVGYIVKKLGASVKTAVLIAAIIIALGTLLAQLPAIIHAFQTPPTATPAAAHDQGVPR